VTERGYAGRSVTKMPQKAFLSTILLPARYLHERANAYLYLFIGAKQIDVAYAKVNGHPLESKSASSFIKELTHPNVGQWRFVHDYCTRSQDYIRLQPQACQGDRQCWTRCTVSLCCIEADVPTTIHNAWLLMGRSPRPGWYRLCKDLPHSVDCSRPKNDSWSAVRH
jgi:hypothetical protein